MGSSEKTNKIYIKKTQKLKEILTVSDFFLNRKITKAKSLLKKDYVSEKMH
jgi:hypothetical protein